MSRQSRENKRRFRFISGRKDGKLSMGDGHSADGKLSAGDKRYAGKRAAPARGKGGEAERGKNDKRKRPGDEIPAEFSLSPRTRIAIEVQGYNLTRLVSRLGEAGIKVYGAKKPAANRLILRIAAKDSEKTFAICKSMWYNYNVVSRSGLFAYLRSRANRAGVLLGAAIVFAAMTFMGSFCLGVEIEGTNRVPARDIKIALASGGIRAGAKLADVDEREAARLVRGVAGVAEASVRFRGGTLVVSVAERDESTAAEVGKKAIFSGYDAVVTKVICSGGTAAVKAGDAVKRGDLLIEGALYSSEGNVIAEVPARGAVYGRVSVKRVYEAVTGGTITRRTGRSATVTRIKLPFGGGGKKLPFATCETERTEAVLNAFLPIRAERITCYETEKTRDERTIEEIAEYYRREVFEEFVAEGTDVTVKSHIEEKGGNVYEITVYAEAERALSADKGE